jgi:hypothetical protein
LITVTGSGKILSLIADYKNREQLLHLQVNEKGF